MVLKQRHSFTYALVALFAVWALFLSGVMHPLTATPGLYQLLKLEGLHAKRKAQLLAIEHELERTKLQISQIQSDPVVQDREIRRTLGYVKDDEMVFDFSSEL